MLLQSVSQLTERKAPNLKIVKETSDKTSDCCQSKVLCVDDEPETLNALSRMLRRNGYLVDTEYLPLKALDLVAKNQYDIIISDMKMPRMDGAEFLSETLKLSPSSIRILLTGHSEQEETVRAINDAKVYGYLNKPWNNQAFRKVVKEALHYKLSHNDKKHNNDSAIIKQQRRIKNKLNRIRLFNQIDIEKMNVGEKISRNIYSKRGILLLAKNTLITKKIIKSVAAYANKYAIYI